MTNEQDERGPSGGPRGAPSESQRACTKSRVPKQIGRFCTTHDRMIIEYSPFCERCGSRILVVAMERISHKKYKNQKNSRVVTHMTTRWLFTTVDAIESDIPRAICIYWAIDRSPLTTFNFHGRVVKALNLNSVLQNHIAPWDGTCDLTLRRFC